MSNPLRSKREKIVRKHMAQEVSKDVEGTINTFSHPQYEVLPTGEIYTGKDAVKSFLQESMDAFPDFTFELHELHHADNAVIVETSFLGTHLGNWRGIPPTDHKVSYRMTNVFVFQKEKLICERINFDLLTILTQLGVIRDVNTKIGRLTLFATNPSTFLLGWARQIFSKRVNKL